MPGVLAGRDRQRRPAVYEVRQRREADQTRPAASRRIVGNSRRRPGLQDLRNLTVNFRNHVQTGDCVRNMNGLPAGCASLVFADIPGFSGYQAADDGSIWSYKGRTPRRLKTFPYRNGYVGTHLRRDGRTVTCLVHCLILLAFRGPPKAGQQTRHEDGVRSNNRLSNLLYGTQSQNEKDKERHGTANRLGGAKIDRDSAEIIRRRVAAGETQRAVARDFHITPANVCVIVKGGSW